MLGFAALLLATASAGSSPALTSSSSWWEKVTYTISGDGAQQSCTYESSIAGARTCDASHGASPIRGAESGSAGALTKITIERRFTPGFSPQPINLETGDTLLGGKIIALGFDAIGALRSCQVLATSGDVRPAYGCREARAEGFKASVPGGVPNVQQGFMTILVYGHEEALA